MIECRTCKKTYSTISNYNKHIKRSPKCIPNDDLEREVFECVCGRKYSTKYKLETHKYECEFINTNSHSLSDMIIALQNKNRELENKVATLQSENAIIDRMKLELESHKVYIIKLTEELADIAKKPSISCINYNNYNLAPLTDLDEHTMRKTLTDKLTKDSLALLGKGVASAVSDMNITVDGKRYIVCVDPSRRMFLIKDDTGNTVKDPYARTFLEKIKGPLLERIEEIIRTEYISDDDMLMLDDIRDFVIDLKINTDTLASELSKKCLHNKSIEQ